MRTISIIDHAMMEASHEFRARERLARRRARRHGNRGRSPSTVPPARLDGELIRAVELILAHPGKVIVTGIGKSGHIARKIVATLCSTGTAAVFLHPAEAVHGDLGIYTPGDPTVLLSKHGTSGGVAGAGATAARSSARPDRHSGQRWRRRSLRRWTCCWMHRWSARPIRTTWRRRPAPSRPWRSGTPSAIALMCARNFTAGGVRPLPSRRATRPQSAA